MDEVYEPRYTYRITQPSNTIFADDAPPDGFFMQFMVDDRYENFYYSSIENLWKFYDITTGPVHTSIAFYSPREVLLSETSDWEYISPMLLQANIPLHAQVRVIPHIKQTVISMASEPSNGSPKLLPILVEITKWSCVDITQHIVEENYGIGGGDDDDELLAQIASLSIDENVPRLTPAAADAISEMLSKVKIEAADEVEACTICLEKFSVGLEVIQMPCKHVFHGACILQWLQNRNLCPLCRFEMPAAPATN